MGRRPSLALLLLLLFVSVVQGFVAVGCTSNKLTRYIAESISWSRTLKRRSRARKQDKELASRANNQTLAGAVMYFQWVDGRGYRRSTQRRVARNLNLPAISVWGGFLVDAIGSVSGARKMSHRAAVKALGVHVQDNKHDRELVWNMLVQELHYFQSFFKSDHQTYLLGGDIFTSADFFVLVHLNHLVGGVGSDNESRPCLPELKKETEEELARLWKWHQGMQKILPFGKTSAPASQLQHT